MTAVYARRHDGGPDLRGNTRDRKARREWLINAWRADVDAQPDPDPDHEGRHVPALPWQLGEPACRCYRCGALLTVNTVTADRITPGAKGGRYVRDNIRPACMSCNSITGTELREELRHTA